MRVLGGLPMFVSGFESGIKEAEEAGITDAGAKYGYAALTGGVS